MSQLFAAFGIDWRLLTINLVNFALLLVVLRIFLYRPLISMLAKRQETIAKGIEDADSAAKSLSEAEAHRISTLTQAVSQADSIVAEAEKSASLRQESLIKEGETAASALITQASREAEEIKRKALEETKADVAKLIVMGAHKIVSSSHTQP